MRRTVESALPSSAKTVVVSLRSSRGIPCSMAHLSSMKLPSAPESMSARPLTVMPAHRRTAEIVVRDLGREEMTVALASTPPSTGELWLLTSMKRQNVHSLRSTGRGDSEFAALVPPQRCEPLPAAWVRGQNREEKIPRLVSRLPVVLKYCCVCALRMG